MLRRSLEQPQKQEEWTTVDDGGEILVHRELYEKGFMVVRPYQEYHEPETPPVSRNHITIKGRHLNFAADDPQNPDLKKEFDSLYPKQAASIFSKIPALNPYKDWDIYVAPNIESVDPQTIPGKAIILVPSNEKNKSSALEKALPKYLHAYFIKHGAYLEKTIERKKAVDANAVEKVNVPVKGTLNLKQLQPNETKVFEINNEKSFPSDNLKKISAENLNTIISTNVKGLPENIVLSNEFEVYVAADIQKINLTNLPPKTILLVPQTSPTRTANKEIKFMIVHVVENGKLVERSIEKKVPKKVDVTADGSTSIETVSIHTQSDVNLQLLSSEERGLLNIGSKEAWQPTELKKISSEIKTLSIDQINSSETSKTEKEKSTADILSSIAAKILSKENISPFPAFLHNHERRNEFFVPIPQVGLYLSAYSSAFMYETLDETLDFSEINNFVTAVCMFGPNLKAKDNKDNEFILIKHDKEYYGEQKIVDISYNPRSANPYEVMLFSELERQTDLILKLSNPEDKPELRSKEKYFRFHLPYIDYMLFGVELFIRGRITRQALGHLFKCILKKREEYIAKINDICSKKQITPIIESPFENLFSSLDLSVLTSKNPGVEVKYDDLAKIILTTLGVPTNEIRPETINEKKQKENEKNLVHSILQKLKAETVANSDVTKSKEALELEKRRRQVWQDTLSAIDSMQKKFESEVIQRIATKLCSPTQCESLQEARTLQLQSLLNVKSLDGVKDIEKQVELLLSKLTTNELENFIKNIKNIISQLDFDKSSTTDNNHRIVKDSTDQTEIDTKANDQNKLEEISYWKETLKLLNKVRIRNLEDLFKRANATEVAIASFKMKNTVSELPLTESRIPFEHVLIQQHFQQMEKEAWNYLLTALKEEQIFNLTDLYAQKENYTLAKIIKSSPADTSNLVERHLKRLLDKAEELAKARKSESSAETTSLIHKTFLKPKKVVDTFQFETDYPSTLNLTHIDPFLPYGAAPKQGLDLHSSMQEECKPVVSPKKSGTKNSSQHGQAFYFAQSSTAITNLLQSAKHGLTTVYKNVGLFTRKSKNSTNEEKPIPIPAPSFVV